jgi:starch synthase
MNTLGLIAFITPELGKWTTTGGLGVMVDELTQELASMNENVIVVTPYYEVNKKGESDYMKKEGFEFTFTIDIWMLE